MRFTTSDGTPLYYEEHPGSPLVVLLHGWPLNGTFWHHQVTALRGYGLLVPDLRGFGKSGVPETDGFSLDRYVQDLEELLDGRPAFLVGHSFGGFVAQAFATSHPAQVRGLVLIDSFATNPLEERVPKQAIESGLRLIARLLPRAPADHNGVADFSNHRGGHDLLTWLRGATKSSWRSVLAALREMFAHDLRENLGRIGKPTLVIVGERDVTTPKRISEELARLTHAELLIVPKAFHQSPLAKPDVVNEALLDFLAKHK